MAGLPDNKTETLCRWGVYVLIALSTATMLARIATVRASTGETPMLSANDRSRWCTVRALVEDGTYAIDRVVDIRHPETNRRYWRSIDMVRHRGPDGREHYYSSKPPLFPTLLAGQYWLIRAVTGATLADEPFFVIRSMLVITNVLPLLVYFLVLWRLVQSVSESELTTLLAMAAATHGTLVTTFVVTMNNHLMAAISVLLATALVWKAGGGARHWAIFAGAGVFAAFAVVNDLPALSFFAGAGAVLLWLSPRLTGAAFVPAAAVVAAAFFGTNYLSHGTLVPPYAQRTDGKVLATLPLSTTRDLDQQQITEQVRQALHEQGIALSDQALIVEDRPGERWTIWDRVGAYRYAVVRGTEHVDVRKWGNWYHYPGSYWMTERQGVDRGEASPVVYAIHVLVGHHGIFSLTPLWMLTVVGCVMMVRGTQPSWRVFGVLVILLTAVCLVFYLSRPMLDRNYGGVSCGFRWMIWFTPLWLIGAVPALNALLRTRWGVGVALVLLMVGVFSASYAADNPWSHPWLFDLGTAAGWWEY